VAAAPTSSLELQSGEDFACGFEKKTSEAKLKAWLIG